jgi:hypothetical protein
MGRFEAGDEDLRMESALDFSGIGAFEKEFDRFFEVGRGRFDSLALTGYVELWTKRNIARPFLFDDRGIASRGHSRLPQWNENRLVTGVIIVNAASNA